MKNMDINGFLGDYRIIDVSDRSLILRDKRNISKYIVAITIPIIFSLAIVKFNINAISQNTFIFFFTFVLLLSVMLILVRVNSKQHPFIISLQRGTISMKYRKLFGGTNDIVYNYDLLLSVQPICFSIRENNFISLVRINLKSDKNVDITFSKKYDIDKTIEEATSAATIFSKILGVKLHPYLLDECALTSGSS